MTRQLQEPAIDPGRAWEFGLRNRDFYGSYQNHKETIAWLATAFFVGGISALMLSDAWPKWSRHERIGLLLAIAGATWLVTRFVIWQFDQRTFAVTMVDASTAIATRWAREVPSATDLEPRSLEGVNWPAVLVREFEEARPRAIPRIRKPKRYTILAIVVSGSAACLKILIGLLGGTETVPILGELMELRGASLWILFGGGVALLGGLLSLVGAIKNSREQTDLILGQKGAFCQLTVYVDATVGWYLSTQHYGGGNVYDVQVLIQEVTEDGTPVSGFVRQVVGTLTSNTWPWPLFALGTDWPTANAAPRYFAAQVVQRNGTGLQAIVLRPKPGRRVEIGFLRLEFERKDYTPYFGLLPQGASGFTVPTDEINRIRAQWKSRNPYAWP